MRITTNSPVRGGNKSPPRTGHYVGHSFATQVNIKYFFYLKFWFKVKLVFIYGEMRIETHCIFKVSVFATQVKIKYFLLKILV